MLYPIDECFVTILDSDGNRWELREGQLIMDEGEQVENEAPEAINVVFHNPQVIHGRTYAVEQVFLKLGGTPIPGETLAAKCDDAHWMSTREDVEEWLVKHGLSLGETQELILDAIARRQ
jgi:hypothetical protein